ncbi:hypothetical protein D3H55_13515 [Bacillus salacetis]|uniref:Uncharacterized protein n=1 Tax=Bacillus salacetis TaxID=2315464 RepID=A0A3A1R085_9BACI|nr:hypothetical protein D3H55_13515 [Bacillus salacetis]
MTLTLKPENIMRRVSKSFSPGLLIGTLRNASYYQEMSILLQQPSLLLNSPAMKALLYISSQAALLKI